MPSKTFHLERRLAHDLEDLFQDYLVLAALLEASALILAGPPPDEAQVSASIARADLNWVRFWRKYGGRPN